MNSNIVLQTILKFDLETSMRGKKLFLCLSKVYCVKKIVDKISNLVRTTCFWNNLHEVRSKSKDWPINNNKSHVNDFKIKI